jgi:hypothetical protein
MLEKVLVVLAMMAGPAGWLRCLSYVAMLAKLAGYAG